MVTESRIISGGGTVSFQLVPCANSNGNEDSNQNTQMILVNGVQTYKRRRHSQSSSGDDVTERARIATEAGRQLMDKDSVQEQMDIVSDGSCTNDQANVHVITEPCQQVFHDVIVSEKYDMLCKLLSDNFQSIKIESFSEISIINSRMRDGAYSHSPQLFRKDVQQLGLKFQNIGAEVISLVEGLSDISKTLLSEEVVGGFANGTCVEENHNDINQGHPGNIDCKPDQAGIDNSCACGCCGGKTDDRICITCNSCEKSYHVFCVGVSVFENSPRSWFCMNCVRAGSESPHEKCVVCERVNNPDTETHASEDKRDVMTSTMLSNVDERSSFCITADVAQQSTESTTCRSCKLCRCEFENNQYRECEHFSCNNIFHLRCLSELELKRFGRRWYCPSCLCRVCLIDQDDEEIVLCDGCDNAFHIYCMEPPRSSIPEGKWFCKVCDIKLQAIREAKKRVYENHQREGNTAAVGSVDVLSYANTMYKNHGKYQNGISGRVHTAVSVDMLLSAAEKLNNDEKLVH